MRSILLALPIVAIAWPAAAQGARARPESDSAESHYAKGVLLEQQRNFTAAAAAYEEAIGRSPGLAKAHDRLGFVHGQLGRTVEALAQFEKAVALDPEALRRALPPRRHALVDERPGGRAGRTRGGVASPTRPSPKRGTISGSRSDSVEQLDRAIEHLSRAVALAPSLAVAHLQLGIARQEQGDLDGAIAASPEGCQRSTRRSRKRRTASAWRSCRKERPRRRPPPSARS